MDPTIVDVGRDLDIRSPEHADPDLRAHREIGLRGRHVGGRGSH